MKNYACTRGDPREWKEIHISRFRWGSCDSCGEVPQVFGCYREKQQHTEDLLLCTQTVFPVLTGNRERLQAYKIRGLGGVCGMASKSI